MKHPMQCAKCFRVCRLSDSGKTWVCTICKHREKANGGQAVSDTPMTDEKINGKPCTRFECLVGDSLRDALVPSQFARQLERELNAANERIKWLEDAGDAMMSEPCEYTFEQWIKAKEAKL